MKVVCIYGDSVEEVESGLQPYILKDPSGYWEINQLVKCAPPLKEEEEGREVKMPQYDMLDDLQLTISTLPDNDAEFLQGMKEWLNVWGEYNKEYTTAKDVVGGVIYVVRKMVG